VNRRAFSLIELLIVMVLMILMYMMMFSPASKSYQAQQKADCARNLQQMFVALKIYATENAGKFPVVDGATTSEEPLSLLVPKYTTMTGCFTCPGSGDKKLPVGEPFAGGRVSYAYYMGLTDSAPGTQPLVSDRQVNDRGKKKGDAVFSADGRKPGGNHRKFGGVVLFGDGRAVEIDPVLDRDLPCPEGIKLLEPRG
jgi:type II secretory pathway pseudopilin PulG